MQMVLEDKEPKRMKAWHSSETSDPQSAPPLPPEIIVDILSRLPVESLLRIRSVCKLWCSIISDPYFVKSHLSLSISNNRYAHHRLIFSTVPTISVKSCRLYDVLYDGSLNALELDYPLKDPFDSVRIAGSCNGLFLIANDDDMMYIWNPSTRRSHRIPCCGSKWRPGWFEFGYDEYTDDYKVVVISCVFRVGIRYDTIVKIYSMKTGNWKKISDCHNGFPFDSSVKYLNGVLHWGSSQNSESSCLWTILSIDLAKETYGEILQPEYDEGHKNLTLGALGELLCVLCDYGRNYADVWVMKVYGVKDSWTKLVCIPYLTDNGCLRFSVPLCISNDGKVLLKFGMKLVVYDSKTCSYSEIQNFNECLEAYTFVESLVSPDSSNPPTGPEDNNQG